MLLKIFNLFSTLKQFLEGHYMSGIYHLNGSCKNYRNYNISDLDMSKFFSVFFSGTSVCTYTTAATVSEILLYIGSLNKTGIAYAQSISPINTVQNRTLKF